MLRPLDKLLEKREQMTKMAQTRVRRKPLLLLAESEKTKNQKKMLRMMQKMTTKMMLLKKFPPNKSLNLMSKCQ